MPRAFPAALFVIVLLLSFSFTTQAEDIVERTWELGIGLGAVSAPDYRGSRQYRHYLTPVPYAVYRGRILNVDRDGLRGDFFRHERVEFNISATAAFTPESHKNNLRDGMPELYSTVELGPAININLSGNTFAEGWHLSFPLRLVISVGDLKPDVVGWLAQPQLVYRHQLNGWAITYRSGLNYADRDYHDHYYTVAERYATPNRPAFQATGGYSGWSNQIALSRREGQWWYGAFLRHDNLKSTQFEDSPLVETRESYNLGIALSRVLF